MLSQKHFQCVQLLRKSLNVVETVHADQDLTALESLFELLEPLLHLVGFEPIDELHRVDSNGVCPDLSITTLKLNAVGHCFETKDAGT